MCVNGLFIEMHVHPLYSALSQLSIRISALQRSGWFSLSATHRSARGCVGDGVDGGGLGDASCGEMGGVDGGFGGEDGSAGGRLPPPHPQQCCLKLSKSEPR